MPSSAARAVASLRHVTSDRLNGTLSSTGNVSTTRCSASSDEVQIGKFRLVYLTAVAGADRASRYRAHARWMAGREARERGSAP